jgi:hypothetical protein
MTDELGVNSMIALVRDIVRALVDDPQSVKVYGQDRDGYVVVNVTVSAPDMGKLIGKQGRTARALRTIVYAASLTNKVRCEVNFVGDKQEGTAAA